MPSTSLGIIVQHSTRTPLPINSSTQPKVTGARQTLEQEAASQRLSPRFNAGLNTTVVLIVLGTLTANIIYVISLVT